MGGGAAGLRWGRRAVPNGGLLLAAARPCSGRGAGMRMTVTLVCFCVSMAGVGASEAAYWTTAVDLGGPYGGTAAAILNTGGNAGGLPAPIITALAEQGLRLGCRHPRRLPDGPVRGGLLVDGRAAGEGRRRW